MFFSKEKGDIGLIKESTNFLSLIDGFVESIKKLHGFSVTHIENYPNYCNIFLKLNEVKRKINISISNQPVGYSILLQEKQLSNRGIEEFKKLREIRVEGDNNPMLIEQDLKNIIMDKQSLRPHMYFPF